MEAMSSRHGGMGAALGAALVLVHYFLSGAPEDGAVIGIAVGAVLGCYWMIFLTVGLLNGYARSIRWGGAVLGLFMLAVGMGVEQRDMTPYLSLLCGVGLGTMAGAMLPLAVFRLCARLEPKNKLRRFSLLLAYPSIRFHEDNPKSIVSDSEPFETKLHLQEQWGVVDREDLHALLESLRAEERLGQTVEVTRWAVTAFMLSKAEGWAIIERAGRRAQELYRSWDDFAANDALVGHLAESQQKRGLWKPSTWPKA
jgi:hypothetical protein